MIIKCSVRELINAVGANFIKENSFYIVSFYLFIFHFHYISVRPWIFHKTINSSRDAVVKRKTFPSTTIIKSEFLITPFSRTKIPFLHLITLPRKRTNTYALTSLAIVLCLFPPHPRNNKILYNYFPGNTCGRRWQCTSLINAITYSSAPAKKGWVLKMHPTLERLAITPFLALCFGYYSFFSVGLCLY